MSNRRQAPTDLSASVCDNQGLSSKSFQDSNASEGLLFPSDRMSEAMDKVGEVRELPLFPLPTVLFPGMPMPLHIFEPRYRKMLSDVQAGDSLFGLSYFEPGNSDEAVANERDIPPAGHAGCVAEVTEAESLPDGRSNILTVGVIRYRVESYVESDEPYLVARVVCFEDDEEHDEGELSETAAEVATMFMRVARAIRVINDERGNLPDISDIEPQKLSFLVAAAMELEGETKQELLELRSTGERLRRLRDMLKRVISSYEERARLHSLAKGNGHGGRKVEIE